MQPDHHTSFPRREDRPAGRAGGREAALRSSVREPLPPPPAPVARLLESGIQERRFLFPDNGTVRIVETWQPPSEMEDGVAGLAMQHLSELEAALRPAERGVLLARILALLSHFRAEPNPPQVEQMIADDWAEDLGEFPIWAVEQACRQWRRTRKWRPQICETAGAAAPDGGEAKSHASPDGGTGPGHLSARSGLNFVRAGGKSQGTRFCGPTASQPRLVKEWKTMF